MAPGAPSLEVEAVWSVKGGMRLGAGNGDQGELIPVGVRRVTLRI